MNKYIYKIRFVTLAIEQEQKLCNESIFGSSIIISTMIVNKL